MRSAPIDRRQPMRDHQRGAALHDLVERLLHQSLAFRIERAGRLVQQQDRRVAQHRPGNGDPLPLSCRQRHAALPEHGVVALRQTHDEVVGEGGLGGRLDLAPARLFACRRRYWRRPCRRTARSPAAPARSARRSSARSASFTGNAVDLYLASVGIVEPQQQREDRGLARARRTDQRYPLARRHAEAQPLERARLGPQRIGRRSHRERRSRRAPAWAAASA